MIWLLSILIALHLLIYVGVGFAVALTLDCMTAYKHIPMLVSFFFWPFVLGYIIFFKEDWFKLFKK
jgi:hypothetical protein